MISTSYSSPSALAIVARRLNATFTATDMLGATRIAVLSLRSGDVAGEHTVSFGTLGERLELTHRAHSRDTFARGALRAVRFVAGRSPGLYSMQDALGLA